jgi:hypothetical protein
VVVALGFLVLALAQLLGPMAGLMPTPQILTSGAALVVALVALALAR